MQNAKNLEGDEGLTERYIRCWTIMDVLSDKFNKPAVANGDAVRVAREIS